jgi:hypothetical protein
MLADEVLGIASQVDHEVLLVWPHQVREARSQHTFIVVAEGISYGRDADQFELLEVGRESSPPLAGE